MNFVVRAQCDLVDAANMHRPHRKRLEFVPSCPGVAVRRTASLSLAYYVPGIHVFLSLPAQKKAVDGWTSPAMTALEGLLGGALSRNCNP